MLKPIYLNLYLIIILFCSCNQLSEKKIHNNYKLINNKYANGFKIYNNKQQYIIEVFNPWQNANNAVFKYKIITSETDSGDIKIPLKKVICLSTTHLAFIEKIGHYKKVVGASGTKYINSVKYNLLVKNNKIADVGYEQSLNYETIISLRPDLIFAYSVGSENIGFINKFEEFNIPVIYIADYLESHPLGKAEWIKVFGLFFNELNLAINIFNDIEKEYIEAKSLIIEIENKPNIMTGLLWNESWFVPGGNSFFANFINDAGGNYIWGDNNLRRSYPISMEKVIIDSENANYWIHPGSSTSINEILKIDNRLNILKPLKNKKIYNNNARQNNYGGNDYWESGVINPHIILKDLISIFHNDLLPNYKMKYFKKIE